MHPIELLIHQFLQRVLAGGYKCPQELLNKFSEASVAHLKRQLERENRAFSLRMSNLGKPLCQLELEQAGIKGISYDNNTITRNTFGDICEDVLMFILHAAKVPIVAEQEAVELEIAGQTIKGTLDLVIDQGPKCHRCLDDFAKTGTFLARSCCQPDPRVWDIKSASDWSFKNKFTLPFDKFIEEDTFGYVDQLFLYAESKGYPAGGLIVQNKSTGEIRVMAFPTQQESYRQSTMRTVEAKVNLLTRKSIVSMGDDSNDSKQVSRTKCELLSRISSLRSLPTTKYDTLAEVWRKSNTGNTLLNPKCTMCEYKFHCFPGVQLRVNPLSTAKIPPMNWYVEYKEK